MLNVVSAPLPEYDVVIVGGGFAGASASTALSRDGRSVLIVEARDRLSGRMWSEPDRLGGHPVEWGGAFMLDRESYPLTWDIIDAAGLELSWGSTEPTDLIWFTGGRRRTGSLPVPIHELASLEHLLGHLNELASRIDPSCPIEEQDVSALDVPWPELLKDLDIGPHTRDLWKAHIVTMAGDDWDVPSALPFLRVIASAGSVIGATFFDAPYDTPMAVTLGPQLRDGTAALYEAVTEDSTADVLLSTTVDRVVDSGELVEVWAGDTRITAEATLIAVPVGTLHSIEFEPSLSQAHAQIAAEGVAAQAEKITALVENCPRPFYAHGVPDGDGFATISSTIHEGDRAIAIGFTTSAGAIDPGDIDAVQAALQVYLPEARVVEIAAHDWVADEFSRGTWSYLRPGQTQQMSAIRARRGRLTFAGSDYDSRLGVEGALHSAALAHEDLIAILT